MPRAIQEIVFLILPILLSYWEIHKDCRSGWPDAECADTEHVPHIHYTLLVSYYIRHIFLLLYTLSPSIYLHIFQCHSVYISYMYRHIHMFLKQILFCRYRIMCPARSTRRCSPKTPTTRIQCSQQAYPRELGHPNKA